MGAGQVAISFGMTGPNFTTVSACATGGHAIGEAWETIRRGDADMMIAGGTEAGIYEPLVGGFAAMRALSRRNDDPEAASRPFDQGRDGFVIGEGAGVVVLEALEHRPGPRRDPILAELDRLRRHRRRLAHHAARAGRDRRGSGGPAGPREGRARGRRDIDHVNAHATSTPEGDKAELQAIRTILGDHARDVRGDGQQVDARPHARRGGRDRGDRHDPGDPRRAASRRRSTSTTRTRRGEGLDLTPNRAPRRMTSGSRFRNSFGFGGQNTALIFRRWDP